MDPAPYLAGFPADVQLRVCALRDDGRPGDYLARRYPDPHAVRNDRQPYDDVQALKDRHLRQSTPLHKAIYDGKLQGLKHALARTRPSPACRADGSRRIAKSTSPVCSARHRPHSSR